MKKDLFTILCWFARHRFLVIVAIFLLFIYLSESWNMSYGTFKGLVFICFFVALFAVGISLFFLEKLLLKLLISINSNSDFDLHTKITSTNQFLLAVDEEYEQLETKARKPLRKDYEWRGRKLCSNSEFYNAYKDVIKLHRKFAH